MSDTYVNMEIVYTDAVLEQAATSFFHHFFVTAFGRALQIACVLNIAALGLIFYLGVRDRFMLFAVGLIAALGPVYLAVIYYVYPKKFATALKRVLQPTAHVTIDPTGFGIAAKGRRIELPWSDVKFVLEFPDYFVLGISQLAFAVIPKGSLPVASLQLVRNALKATCRRTLALIIDDANAPKIRKHRRVR